MVAAVGGVAALVAFLLVERYSANPMMPLDIFKSRQFSAANLVTFVVYAALGGVFFLLVSFLQISLGYSPIAAGAASLPVTVLMLLLSARSGALAQRIGPRIPLTVGPLVIAAGLLLMTGINPGDSYVSSVLPAVIVFGLGLTLVVAPVTATVLAAADSRHSGIASGINNAVARVAGLLAVAVLPLIAGLTGDKFYDPVAMADGFRMAMVACAGLSALGGILAWFTISSEVLEEEPEATAGVDAICHAGDGPAAATGRGPSADRAGLPRSRSPGTRREAEARAARRAGGSRRHRGSRKPARSRDSSDTATSIPARSGVAAVAGLHKQLRRATFPPPLSSKSSTL